MPLAVIQSSSVNTPSPRRVSWALKPAWSAPCCRTSPVKIMALSKSWYRLYPLGISGICLEYQRIADWWQLLGVPQKDHREISKWLVIVWACLLEAFADHGEYFLTGHALLIYEYQANIAECVQHAFQPLTMQWQTFAHANSNV